MMTVKAKMSEVFYYYLNFLKLFNCECEIDPACITVVGHSFGGSSALRMAQLDKRIKGIVAIDPWLFPMNKEVLTKPT
jgi:pimeloyl-ACP methyl ester carboxylesterase